MGTEGNEGNGGSEGTDQKTEQTPEGDGEGDQDYLDRSKLDFDPDDGLYTGTAVEGTSEIPGPHEQDGPDDQPAESAPPQEGQQEHDDVDR